MKIPTRLAAGAFALGLTSHASAFLLSPEVVEAVEGTSAQLDVWNTQRQIVDLDCPGCALSGLDGDLNAENTIHLDFSIDQDRQRLQVNGDYLFPLSPPVAPIHLKAPQVRTYDGSATEPQPLGFALEVGPVIDTPKDGDAILPVQLTILDIAGVPVKVDTVKLEVLHSGHGLAIAQVSTIPFEQSPGADCDNSLCRFRAIVQARMYAMMQAAKGQAKAAGHWVKGKCPGKKHGKHPGPDGRPGHHGPPDGHRPHPHGHHKGRPEGHEDHEDHPHGRHGHHGHHGHHGNHGHRKGHRMGHVMRQALRFFIIPALLGVIGGLMASAVGMMVGQALVFLWFRVVRGGQRGNIRNVEVAVEEDEKDALVGGEEAELPPHYEDIHPAAVVKAEDEENKKE